MDEVRVVDRGISGLGPAGILAALVIVLAGAEQALITGLTFGTIYVATGSLALPMIAHASFDVAAVLMIYWQREREVSHLFWK